MHYDRLHSLKEILFDTNAPNGVLDFDKFIEICRIPYARNNKARRFSDFLLAPVPAIRI